MEPLVVELFRESGSGLGDVTVPPTPWMVFTHPDCPWLSSTPDALTHNETWTEIGNVEAKSLDPQFGDPLADGVPLNFQVQSAIQSMCLGVPGGWVAMFYHDQLFQSYVPVPESTANEILLALDEFRWHVENGVPPEPKGGKLEREAIREMFADHTQTACWLPDESPQWDARLQAIQKEMAALKTEKETLENNIALAIGTNTVGVIPGHKHRYKVSRVKTAGHVAIDVALRDRVDASGIPYHIANASEYIRISRGKYNAKNDGIPGE